MLPEFHQKRIFAFGRTFYLLLLAMFLVCGFLLLRAGAPRLPEPAAFGLAREVTLWGRRIPAFVLHLAGVLGSILLALLGGAFLAVQLRNLFWKTSCQEVFFAALFFVSLTLESLRLPILLFFIHDAPLELRLVLTRGVYLGRIFGLGCLLVSSLYAAGLKFGHLSLLAGVLLFISLILSSILPLDATGLARDLLYRLGDPQGYRFAEATLGVIVVLNFCAAGYIRGNPRFLWVALAAAAVAAGRFLFEYGGSPLANGAGAVILLAGGAAFLRRMGILVLWI